MTTFTLHTADTAPEAAKATLSANFVTNLSRVLAEAPTTLDMYNRAFSAFLNETSFSPVEQQVVFMTANFENNCHYCVPGHTWMMKNAKMDDAVIEALREGTPLPDAKLQALHDFTKDLLDKRGHIGDEQLQAFLDAGYSKQQALEVLTGLASKLISNFANALAHTAPDELFSAHAWTHPSER